MTKKKLKVLKQALKDEKELADKKGKALDEFKMQIDLLQKQIAEKDRRYEKLLQEKTNIEDSLLRDNKKKKEDPADLKRQHSGNEYKAIPNKPEKAIEDQSA